MEGAAASVRADGKELGSSSSGPSASALAGAVAVAGSRRLVQTRLALVERVDGTVTVPGAWDRAQIWAAVDAEAWGFLEYC
jgi:hypothetical protein